MRRVAWCLAVMSLLVLGMVLPPTTAPAARVPVLAYYYQWFEAHSWQRAKTDYPRLGRYSSDDADVVTTHIRWARSAGIDGFVVSWKSSPANNRRLALLLSLAREQDFKVAVIYQGLDFTRRPLPVARVAADFALLRDRYTADRAFFRLDGKPLTVFSGTWEYAKHEVEQVTAPVRDTLLVLNTEKNTDGYRRLAAVTDGDAYYWSSVNPETNTQYATKLKAMGEAVHRENGYWLAPFAPGFDARTVGGKKQVPRRDGRTLRTEYATAAASAPDALGLISWNEFSENSHIEPSVGHGTRYLDVVRELRGRDGRPPVSVSGPAGGPRGPQGPDYLSNALRLAGCVAVLVCSVTVLARLRRRRHS